MAELKVGDYVTCDRMRGYFRIASIHLHPYSHSVVEIRQALLDPIGERWVRGQRLAPLHTLHAVPPDLEDLP